MKNIILFLYLTGQGTEIPVYCKILDQLPTYTVDDYGTDNFVKLDCKIGLKNANIKTDKINVSKFYTLRSKCLELSKNEKIIADSLFSKVSKKPTDK